MGPRLLMIGSALEGACVYLANLHYVRALTASARQVRNEIENEGLNDLRDPGPNRPPLPRATWQLSEPDGLPGPGAGNHGAQGPPELALPVPEMPETTGPWRC